MLSNSSYGYGIRYEYGIFTQKIKGTEQVGFYVFVTIPTFPSNLVARLFTFCLFLG